MRKRGKTNRYIGADGDRLPEQGNKVLGTQTAEGQLTPVPARGQGPWQKWQDASNWLLSIPPALHTATCLVVMVTPPQMPCFNIRSLEVPAVP